jgi:DNA-binding beta-propeller fold protein YncE
MPTTTRDLYRYSQTIGFYAQVGRGFNNPVDVALGRDGVLYVLNRAGSDIEVRMIYKRVTMCTLLEEYLGQFGTGGSADGQFMWPAAIAIDADERVYISDEALHRISIFDKHGHFLGRWGTRGRGAGEFDRPAGIAFDAEQHLLVVDGRNHRVQRYTRDGDFLGQWGAAGQGPGEFNLPWGIAVDGVGDIYVADWRNDRVQKFDAGGKFLTSYGTSGRGDGEFRRPAGVAVDAEGYIYVADWGNERVQVLGPDGSFVAKFRGASGLSKWGGDYFIANQDELEERRKANLEPQITPSPSDDLRHESASIEKFFWGPTAVKVDDQGRIYVVDSCRHRIQVYRRADDRDSINSSLP